MSHEHPVVDLHDPVSRAMDHRVMRCDQQAQVSFEQGITSTLVSDESVRRALKRLKTYWKRAKHWITGPDPQDLLKKARDCLIA